MSRNFGAFAAIRAGLQEAAGPYFAVMARICRSRPSSPSNSSGASSATTATWCAACASGATIR
jgi:hypothetical protein